ncbi:non-ribosomal peptide synthetase [Flavobacterium lipolyticum]|uniref:Amino acid adenylation domain-containing protein n=1 Tax=Flavobacterium lipolyticum TaxID=2893754 RepID=A0ABS8M7A4_9FLAO|nr:non-ribosomal peptide synthetase [Flavobacterium sp. F-126]MCC9020569.1 amino acid adenylation domain-containing protein [Flavobacterium sp. F-126]
MKDKKIIQDYWLNKIKQYSNDSSYLLSRYEQVPSGQYSIVLKKNSLDKIAKLSGGNAIAAATIYLSVFNTLLKRYTNNESIWVASSPFNLEGVQPEKDSLLFYHTTISNISSLRDAINATKQEIEDTLLYDTIDFELIEKEFLNIELTPEDYLQYAFVYQKLNHRNNLLAQAKLCLEIEDTTAGKESITIHFDTAKYDALFIQNMVEHFIHILENSSELIDTKVDDIEFITASEKQQLLEFSGESDKKIDASVIGIFEQQVKATPDNIALVYKEKKYTYTAVNRKVNHLASLLQKEYGIKSGDIIGIMTDYSDNTIFSFAAALKLGATYLSLDYNLTTERLDYILSDTQPKAIITQLEYLNDLLHYDIPLFSIDVMLNEENISDVNWENNSTGDIAYIMYTSGSTGVPKGVVVKDKSIVRLVKETNYIEIDPQDRILAISNSSFDGSTFDIWGALLNGATLHIPEKDLVLNFELLFQAITTNEISVVFMTTALFNSMVDTDIDSLKNLRKILFGGEMVSVFHVRKFVNHFGSGRLVHVYGPTENTTFSTFHPVEEVSEEASGIPIGKPISYTQCYILNESMKLQPVGIAGELYVSGEGVAAGYLNQEELTSKSFVENPYQENALLYKTGDICKWLPDGTIEILGRRDSQVKIRGFRIELGEIERKITSYNSITEAVILVNKDSHDVKFLAAFFIADATINTEELRSFLAQKLPNYMVPAHITQVPQIPLNRNGKVDQKELNKLAKSNTETTRELVLPTTEIQIALHNIWKELFDKEDISITDDFFDIGGHSIKAMNLVSTIHKNLNIKIDIGNVFEDRNIKALSETILQAQENEFQEIEALTEQPNYAVSSSQQRFWALSQFQEANKAYTIPSIYTLTGDLDQTALAFAFQTITKRHESFRTTFKEDENQELRQFILPEAESNFEIDFVDFCNRSENELEETINNLIQVAFNLSEGPLLKVSVLQVEESKAILVAVMHHIISDGLSMEVFIEELLHLYKAHKNKLAVDFKPLRIQYKDFAAWQNQQLENESLQVHKAYWTEKFSGELPVLNLQKSKIRPKIKSYNGETITINIDSRTLKHFKNILDQENLTLFMGLLTVTNVLIYKYTNQEDIILGTTISGRNHIDLEGQIGCFINVLPLRSQFSHKDSIIDLFRKVKKGTQEAYEHQIYPFEQLIGDLNLTHDISRNPLFDATVVLQNADLDQKLEVLNSEGLEIALYEKIKATVSRFDISFNFVETVKGLEFSLVYNTDIFDTIFIRQIQKHFHNLLNAVIANPHNSIASLPYLSVGEIQLFTSDFSAGTFNSQVCLDIVEAFQYQVRKTPAQIAVVYKNQQLTYEELDRNANKIAHLLTTEYGVTNGEKVGIILDKSELLISTILGILKAGGVYVPIDVESPKIRKEFIVNDIGAKVIITQMDYMFDLDFFEGSIIAIDVQLDALENHSPAPQITNSPDAPAYIMYTSGSTGNPKGVLVPHKGVTRLVKNTNYIDFDRVHAILSTGSVSFDASTFEFWGALLNGGKLVLCDKEDLLNTTKLASLIKTEKVDTMWFTSGLLNQFTDQDVSLFEGLINVLAGGEKLSAKHIRKLLEAYPELNLINGYGPTENTTFSATYKITAPVEEDIPIGKPINNSKAYILDQNLELCPQGVVGEIYLAGDGLSLGYLNAAELNAEKFLNPRSLNRERVYKTGDLGLWLPNGNIKFFGRKDSQIKLRGYRIELNDIEKTLDAHPDINGAVVVLKQLSEAADEKFIVAYVKSNQVMNQKELKAYLAERLPFYMIPTYFIEVEDFILNKNGKVDKDLLPEIDLSQLEREYISYRNETEKTLSEIWSEILLIEKISVTDDFFEIGGHSLRAVKLANMIQESFGVEVSIGHVFQFRTIETMAEQLRFIQKQEELTANKKDLQEIDIDL